MVYFLLFVGLFIGLGIWQSIKKSNEKKALMEYYQSLLLNANFQIAKKYVQPNGLCMIALDTNQKRFLIANAKTHKFLNYNDILRSEVVIDGQTISSKSASGALTGGLLFGTVGAVVGSNMGKTTFSKDVQSIKLKLLVNDIITPAQELVFYYKAIDKTNSQAAQKNCQAWHDTVTVALN